MYMLLVLCARALRSVCPDVSQLCSTTKQYLIQSNCTSPESPPLPSAPCALFSHSLKKNKNHHQASLMCIKNFLIMVESRHIVSHVGKCATYVCFLWWRLEQARSE